MRSIERGLPLSSWETMTVGMVMGVIVEYDNDNISEDAKKEMTRMATQADFDAF